MVSFSVIPSRHAGRFSIPRITSVCNGSREGKPTDLILHVTYWACCPSRSEPKLFMLDSTYISLEWISEIHYVQSWIVKTGIPNPITRYEFTIMIHFCTNFSTLLLLSTSNYLPSKTHLFLPSGLTSSKNYNSKSLSIYALLTPPLPNSYRSATCQ